MRSATFLEEVDEDEDEDAAEAEDREMMDFEKNDKEGRRWI